MSQTKAQLISDLVQALNFTGTSSAPANGVYLSAANTIKLSTNSLPRITIGSNGEATFAHAVTISTTTDQLLNLNSSDSNATYLAFKRGGTRVSYFGYGGSGSTLTWANEISDADIHLSVNDGGSTITPLKIDASEGGIVELLVSGTTRLATSSTGVTITGTCTATSFSGSGANLTSLPTQVTLNNNSDNRVITGGSGVNLNGESNFTYDGDELAVYANTDDTDCILHLVGKTPNGGVGQAGRTAIIAESTATSNGSSSMHLRTRNSSNSQLIAMTLDSNQNVGIGTQTPSTKLSLEGSAGSTSHGILIGAKNAGGIRGVIEVHTAADTTGFNLSRTGGGSDTDIVLLKNDGDIGVVECRNSSNATKIRLKAGALSYLHSEDSRGHKELLELKHTNTTTTGDGPALLFNGYYNSAEWKYAKISAENSGSGYGAKFKVHVHPADGTQGSNLVQALDILGDGTGANVTITNGDVVIGTNGHGVDFGATAGTNADNTRLDDYERGGFNPTVAGTSAAGTVGYSQQGGYYIKIGRIVHVWVDLTISSASGMTGVFSIQNLPFAKSFLDSQPSYYEGGSFWNVADALSNSKPVCAGYMPNGYSWFYCYSADTHGSKTSFVLNTTGRVCVYIAYVSST